MIHTVDDLLPEIVSDVPGCIDALILKELRTAWRQFCLASYAWRADAKDIAFVDGQARYLVETDAVTAEIREVRRIPVLDSSGVVHSLLRKGREYATGRRKDTRPEIILRSRPTIHHVNHGFFMRPRLVLIPEFGSDGADGEAVLNQWQDAVVCRAKHNLHAMPKRKWSDAPAAMAELAEYKQRVTEALAELRDEEGWLS